MAQFQSFNGGYVAFRQVPPLFQLPSNVTSVTVPHGIGISDRHVEGYLEGVTRLEFLDFSQTRVRAPELRCDVSDLLS